MRTGLRKVLFEWYLCVLTHSPRVWPWWNLTSMRSIFPIEISIISVCVCVCVCVFIFYREGFFRLQDVRDILEGTDQRTYVVNINMDASAKFLHLVIWKYHISPPKTKTPARHKTGEKTIRYIDGQRKDDIYWYRISVGLDSKPTSDEKKLKIRRLL